MRKYLVLAFLLFLCYLLQASVLPAAAFGGIMPNLLIIFVASCGFMNGEICGLVTGFICGLLVDVFGGDVIGFYALIYMIAGYINRSGRVDPFKTCTKWQVGRLHDVLLLPTSS